jgi:hypothetical protein
VRKILNIGKLKQRRLLKGIKWIGMIVLIVNENGDMRRI